MWTGFQECQVSKEFRLVLNWFYDEENLHLRPTEISFGKLNTLWKFNVKFTQKSMQKLVSSGTFKNRELPFSFAYYIGSFTYYAMKEGSEEV